MDLKTAEGVAIVQRLARDCDVLLQNFRVGKIDKFALQADYYNKLLQTIAAVSPAQVKALIARELDPSREIVVTVADKSTLERAFQEAGLNDVKIVEPDYK